MGTLCPAGLHVTPQVPVSVTPILTQGIPTAQQLWAPSATPGKESCSWKGLQGIKDQCYPSQLRLSCHGQAFLGAQKEGRSRSTSPPPELGWAQTAAPARNHHRKVGQFFKTGVRRPAGLSSSTKGTEIYINQLLIR